MRRTLITIIFLFGLQFVHAQNSNVDSLKHLLAFAKDDSTRFDHLRELSLEYLWSYPDSCMSYLQQEILLAKQIQSDVKLSIAYWDYGWFNIIIGDYPQA